MRKVQRLSSRIIWVALAISAAVRIHAQETSAKPLAYFIIVTGGELLEGVYPDAHTPFLTRSLRPLGCQCVGSITVDDNRQDIQRALAYATNLASLVIVTGGLGPTPNDITRETLSEAIGIPLQEDAQALAELEKRFHQRREELRPNVRKQTQVPARGGFLKNANGTAVGLVFDSGGSVVLALPGPPRELQPMVRDELIPFLRQRFGVREFGTTLTLRFVGAGQSLIDQTIKDHVSIAPDVVITSLFEGSRVDFMFSLPGHTPADRERLKGLGDAIREHLAAYIYSDDGSSLEEVVVKQLQARRRSLLLVEIGSGGSVAAALSGAKGAASVLAGAFVCESEQGMLKLLQSASHDLPKSADDRAKFLAVASSRGGNHSVLVIGPSDPAGAKFLWAVLRLPDERWVTEQIPIRSTGEITRATLATQVLDFLRRQL